MLHSLSQIWKAQQWSQVTVFNPISKKGNTKECSNYMSTTIQLCSFHMLGKFMLKIVQARLHQRVNRELPDVQTGFRKVRGSRDQVAAIHLITEKAKEFKKRIYLGFIEYAKVFVLITKNCGKFFKNWEYQTTLLVSWETCMQFTKQKLEPDVE